MELYDIPYKISYRNIKHPRLELRTGELEVILPFGHDSDTVLIKHRNWIFKKTEFIKECLNNSSDKEISNRTETEFKQLIYSFVESFTKELKIGVNKVYFRRMRTKWASCSSKKNLTINTFVKKLPDHMIGYIIFHEVAHVVEMKHSDKFWKLVSNKFPKHDKIEKDLFAYWFLIQSEAQYTETCL
jgi:predicted metal-dependent hydrolase